MSEKEINLKLIIVLGRMTKSITKCISPRINERGITMTQFAVLEALYHKGPLTVNEIINTTLSSSGNMGVVIMNLEKTGMIQKMISETDRRSRKIFLTEKGETLISELFPEHVQDLMENFEGINLSEKRTLIELMKKFGKSIGGEI